MSQAPPAGRAFALEAQGLAAILGGHKVLDVPSLQVYPNEVLTVIGPNGSGKTTLLLCLALLLRPAAGIICYGGKPISNSNRILETRRRLAVVFQDPLLLNSSVWDNVTLGMRLRGVKGNDVNARAQKWLDRFGIASLARRQARTLSGGEAKRVSLARAFVLQPDVLFLDEPFTALDSPTRQSLLEDFERVLRETRVTTVMVTHDRNEALVLADRIAVLMNGSVRQLGSPQEVLGSPVDEDVAGFVEAGNILHGVVGAQSGGLARIDIDGRCIEAVSSLPAGTAVTVYLHYEDVTLSQVDERAAPSSARNRIRGKIVKVFPLGSQLKVTLDCGFLLASVITRRSWEELGFSMGQELAAYFKASSVRLFPNR